ncbi:MAG: nylA 1 [Deltaproteobacteria bacterium]|nr:nylA 1 [Deltaproteobacteria bacterium]
MGRALREDDIEPFTRFLLEQGRAITGAQVVQSLQDLELAGRAVVPFFSRYDVLLTPTVPVPTPTLGTRDTTRVDTMMTQACALMGFTGWCNVTGQPAMSIPCGIDPEGLPIGVHFAAAFGRDDVLLRLAAQIEEAAPWPRMAPCA